MFWRNFLSFRRSPTVAIAKWLACVLHKDTSRFMQRYPALSMTPDQAYRAVIARVLENLPEHIPIAAKLAIAITWLLTLGMLGLGILIGTNQARLLDNQIALLSDMVVAQLGEAAKGPLLANDVSSLESLAQKALSLGNIAGIALYSGDLQMVTTAGSVPADLQLQNSSGLAMNPDEKAITWTGSRKSGEHSAISLMRAIRHRNVTIGHIVLSFDGSGLTAAKERTIRMVTTSTVMMIGLGILASFMLGNWLTRPINELIRVSRSIVNGNYDFELSHGRRNDEIGILLRSMDTMGQGLLRKEQVEKVFSRYVSDSVARQVLQDLENIECAPLQCEYVQASVVFADMAGYSTLSESASPKEISELLNLYFAYIAKAVQFCNGHIDKYIGDCAMIVFGVPEKNGDHACHAVACAWMIQRLIEGVNRRRISANNTTVKLRIGINSGTMVAGNLGSADRINYTVVGDAVNIASRLSHAGEPGEIIITEDVLLRQNLNHLVQTEFGGEINLRGRKKPVSILRVMDINAPSRNKILLEIDRLLETEPAEPEISIIL